MARIKNTQVVMKVSLTLPSGVNLKDGQDYVRDAVKGWIDRFARTGSMTNFEPDTVKVSLVSSTTNYDH